MRLNTTGYYNAASGHHSLYSNTTGHANVAIGRSALIDNTTGSDNTASGYASLSGNTTGSFNTAIGYFTADMNITGTRNTILGAQADVSAGNLVNATALGSGAIVTASNRVRVGNVAVTSIGGQVGWTVFSDGRYKKDIRENVQGLAFINSLRPITYTVNVKAVDDFYNKRRSASRNSSADDEDKTANAEMDMAKAAGAEIIYNGFVAQEVELAAKKLNFEFSGVDKPANDDGLYGLRYDNFISPLVKSVQELSRENDEKDSLISDLQTQVNEKDSLISDLQTQFNDLQSMITKALNGIPITSSGYLKQNAPNPFSRNTVISYQVPHNAGHAQIRITDVTGRLIKVFNAAKGEGKINIRNGELPAGTYSYTLYVDNNIVDTRQMVMLK